MTQPINPSHSQPDGADVRPAHEALLLSGNEAVARGARDGGAAIGAGYPGTPSTEVLEALTKIGGVYTEWAPNEKVALEVGIGASFAGGAALVTMKHVGLNVAADPLLTAAYTGVNGALVVLVADDPGMHSSQNEQDSHNYAAFAGVPMLDPADPQEAYDFTRQAFAISARYRLPVLVRTTVRVAHAKQLVSVDTAPQKFALGEMVREPARWVMMPNYARAARITRDDALLSLEAELGSTGLNIAEHRSSATGVICAGVVYHYVREALPDASVLKLGITYPLDIDAIRAFAATVDRLVVAEEADDFLARALRAAGINVETLRIPRRGELTPELVRVGVGEDREAPQDADPIVGRPPLLCPGCPHRPVFYELKRMNAIVSGDIGCYTLAAVAPLSAIDTCVCMGASVSMAHGMELVGDIRRQAAGVTERPAPTPANPPIVAVIGDSTFAHSGITSLLNTTYNGGAGTVLILDNRITAMTGHQGNPVNGVTLGGSSHFEVDLAALVKACGVEHVRVVDPNDLPATAAALREETARPEYSVIVFKAPCALLPGVRSTPYVIDQQTCNGCKACLAIGCQPIMWDPHAKKASIERDACVGCGLCAQVCRFGCISVEEVS